jgi:hypothetical protein
MQWPEMISKWISSRRRPLGPSERRVLSIVGALLGLLLLAMILAGLEFYRGDKLQARRNAEQARLVETMESLHIPAISEVLTDWLLTYPEPNDERLAELRDLARQVESDPAPLLGTTAPSKISEALPLESSRAAAEDAPRTVVVRHGGSR